MLVVLSIVFSGWMRLLQSLELAGFHTELDIVVILMPELKQAVGHSKPT